MVGLVKCFSPQNTAGVSQEKGVAVIPQTTEVNSDQFSNKKTKKQTTLNYKLPSYCLSKVILES